MAGLNTFIKMLNRGPNQSPQSLAGRGGCFGGRNADHAVSNHDLKQELTADDDVRIGALVKKAMN